MVAKTNRRRWQLAWRMLVFASALFLAFAADGPNRPLTFLLPILFPIIWLIEDYLKAHQPPRA